LLLLLMLLQGMFSNTLLIIAMCASSILIYALLLVIGVKPWWSPQYLIPILGECQQCAANKHKAAAVQLSDAVCFKHPVASQSYRLEALSPHYCTTGHQNA
jgi:ABC-type iron transport system FetAB permease component